MTKRTHDPTQEPSISEIRRDAYRRLAHAARLAVFFRSMLKLSEAEISAMKFGDMVHVLTELASGVATSHATREYLKLNRAKRSRGK